jgi:hypothetical protein
MYLPLISTILVVLILILNIDLILTFALVLISTLYLGRGSIPGRDNRLFCTPQRSDRLCGSPSLLSNGYQGALFRGKAAGP